MKIATHLIAVIHLCSIAISITSNRIETMTEQQRSNISNLGKSCQQAEDALSQGMDKLQQMVLESVAAGQLEEQTNTPNMSTAMERLAVLKVLEADKCLEVVFEIPLLYTEIGLFVDPPSVFMSNNTWSLLLPEGFQIENLKLGNIINSRLSCMDILTLHMLWVAWLLLNQSNGLKILVPTLMPHLEEDYLRSLLSISVSSSGELRCNSGSYCNSFPSSSHYNSFLSDSHYNSFPKLHFLSVAATQAEVARINLVIVVERGCLLVPIGLLVIALYPWDITGNRCTESAVHHGQDSRCHDQEDLQPLDGKATSVDVGGLRERHGHLTIWLHPDIKKALYSKSLDRDAMITETFKYTHTLKQNKERFTYQWYAYHYRLEAATQQSQHIRDENNNSVASEVDPNIVWHETTSDPYKNRIYELGSFFADNLRTSTLRPSFASATNSPMEQQMPVYQDQMRASGSDAADGSGTSGGASAPPPSLSPQHD
ncbi:hypothetical protein Ahy_B01g054051 isoform G [Arachis hypogaea]|uniref:Uncharacterized protein n=1 Tax=Arachis hypogaea TaxID=3818 RepID=A0A445AT72_ARAHY|nr:hypothetical protein Ahy_B01g054051 isoform G [Arachis hypogaea]